MSTITSLKFAVSSSWDSAGIDEAKSSIMQLKSEIESMSNSRLKFQAELEGAEEVQAKVDEISRDRDAMVKVTADTAEATAKVDEVARNKDAVIKVKEEGAAEAKALIDSAATDKKTTIHTDSSEAESGISRVKSLLSSIATRLSIGVSADTSGAESSFSSLTGALKGSLLMVGALTAALTGLGAVASLVGGALLTALGGGVIAAGAGISAMYKKMQTDAQNAITMQQAQADTANNQLASAYENVTEVATNGAQQIQSAQQAVASSQLNVQMTVEEGARAVHSASEQAVQANNAVIQSQRDVAQAYKDTQRNLEDLQMQQSESGDNIESAAIAVARAQDNVRRGPQKGSTDPALDQRANLNSLALAQDHYRATVLKAQQTNEDYTKAQAQGVDGSDKVVQAKQKEQDAVQKAADAQQTVQFTIQKAAENNQKAQQQLSNSVQKLAYEQKRAAEDNAKAQRELQNAQIGAADAQRQLNQAIAKGTSGLMEFMKQLNDIVAPMQGPLKAALASMKQQLTEMTPALKGLFANAGNLIQPFTDGIMGAAKGALPGMSSALANMTNMMPGMKSGMISLGTATGNMFDTLGKDAKNLGQIAADFGVNFGKFINIWADFTNKTGPDAANTLNHMGQGINALTQGGLNGVAGFEHNAAPDKGKKGVIQSAFSGVGTIAQSALPVAGALTKDVSEQVSPMIETAANAIAKIIDALKPALPLIKAFTEGFGGTFRVELQILAPILEGVAKFIGAIATGLQPLAPVITVLAVAFGIWRTATIAYTVAQAALNIVMDANPISLLIIAIAALVGGIIYLATKTQFFQTVWRDVWNFVKMVAGAVWDWIKQAWNDTLDFLKRIWDNVSGAIKTAWNAAWNWIKKAASDVWDAIKLWWNLEVEGWKAVWHAFLDIIKTVWNDAWGWIKDAAKGIWDGIKSAFDWFADKFHQGFQGMVDKVKDIWNGMKKIFADPINFIIRASNDTIGKVIQSAHMDEIKLAGGGMVPGNGHPKADDVPAMLSSKEFVTNAAATQKNLGVLHHINNGGMAMALANGGAADGSKDPNGGDVAAINRAVGWASGLAGQEYNAQGWLDCSGLASGVFDVLEGKSPHREFTTVSNFESLGFKPGTGGIAEIGVLPNAGDAGHMAMTVGGHNIESAGGGKGIQVDGSAWGADNPYFTRRYYLPGNLFSPAYTGAGADPGANPAAGGGHTSFFGMIGNAVTGALHALRGGAAQGFIDLTNPILAGIPNPFGGTNKPFGSYPKAEATAGRDALANLIRGNEAPDSASSGGAPFGGSAIPSAEHKALIDQAVALAGGPAPNTLAQWESGLETLVTRESGWNPAAINNWDSNAAAGHPSKGLAQMIDSSFNAHKVPGHDNIWNGLDNLASDVGYIKSTYGGITNVQQANSNLSPHGYATGTGNADPGWAMVGELGPELVKFTGGEQVLNNKDTMNRLNTMNQYMSQGAQGIVQSHQSALTDAVNSNIDQAGQDLGIGSITSGSGVISQLFKQGISYGSQLATWTPPAGSLLGMATKGAPNPLSAFAGMAPGTGVLPGKDAQLDNPPSAAQAQAQANQATKDQAAKLNGGNVSKGMQPMVGGDLHLHAAHGDVVKDWHDRLDLHHKGFDPLGL